MNTRERYLVITALSLVIVVVFIFLLYRPLSNRIILASNEINTLNNELNQLTLEYKSKKVYEDEIEDMQDYVEEMKKEFPGYTTQESIIYTMLQIEAAIDSLEIPSYSMERPVVLVQGEAVDDDEADTVFVEGNFMETKTQLSVQMNYQDMKNFLEYIRNYEKKLSIESLNISNDLENNLVSMNFSLNFYSLSSLDFVPKDYFGDFEKKEGPIFEPYEEAKISVEDQEYNVDVIPEVIKEEDDIVLSLSSIYSDGSNIIMYVNGDTQGTTTVYSDEVDRVEGELVFEQVGTSYSVKYKVNNDVFPVNYNSSHIFVPGKVINVRVRSSYRIDDTDVNGIDMTVFNSTDLPVEIEVINDDTASPRFSIVKQTGTVSVNHVVR